jgi:plastocyanin domain-containing protein
MRPTFLPVAVLVLGLGVAQDVQAAAKPARAAARTIAISVTSEGFVPAEVTAKAGQPLKLVVTRQVERTCATEIVMTDFGVNQPLPFGKPVTVTVTPKKPGAYRFACGMDMIAGVLNVE